MLRIFRFARAGALVTAALLFAVPPLAAQQRNASALATARVSADTTRARAIEYSDAYYTRLTIHRLGSYTMLPLFAAQYYLGNQLLSSGPIEDWVRPTHRTIAYATGTLFAVNTVTGVWNLVESRKDPNGRTKRWVHTGLMLAASAGFAYTGTLAGEAKRSLDGRDRHRAAALTSMGLSTAGAALMWFWND